MPTLPRGVSPRQTTLQAAVDAAELGLDPTCTYEVRASFLEVYGNDAFYLLVPTEKGAKRQALRLKEDKGQVYAEGLKEAELPDVETALSAVALGWEQRSASSNGINDLSSRSHAVLCIRLITHRPGNAKPLSTRLCVVDLAGAERQKKTGSSGARLNEVTAATHRDPGWRLLSPSAAAGRALRPTRPLIPCSDTAARPTAATPTAHAGKLDQQGLDGARPLPPRSPMEPDAPEVDAAHAALP